MIFIKSMREFHRWTKNAACLMAGRRQRGSGFSHAGVNQRGIGGGTLRAVGA